MEKNEKTTKEMNNIEILIGKIMRIGVMCSAVFMIWGLGNLLLFNESGYSLNFYPTSLTSIIRGLRFFKPFAFMMTGIWLLILTPVLRVIVSIYAFWKEHDWLYVFITTSVLLILVISFLIGSH